jgi:hypothetical protein
MLGTRGFHGVLCCFSIHGKILELAEFVVDLQIERERLGVRLVREPDDGHELRVLFGRHSFVAGGGTVRGNAIPAGIRYAEASAYSIGACVAEP